MDFIKRLGFFSIVITAELCNHTKYLCLLFQQQSWSKLYISDHHCLSNAVSICSITIVMQLLGFAFHFLILMILTHHMQIMFCLLFQHSSNFPGNYHLRTFGFIDDDILLNFGKGFFNTAYIVNKDYFNFISTNFITNVEITFLEFHIRNTSN